MLEIYFVVPKKILIFVVQYRFSLMKSYFFLKTKNNLDIKRNIGAFVLLLILIVIGNKAWGNRMLQCGII